ncbi:MAG: HDIG domain-containing metalloprotein [Anaerolineae bacterium]
MTVTARAGNGEKRTTRRALWRARIVMLLFGALFVSATAIALTVEWPTTGLLALQVGEVSGTDLRSPRLVEYISDVLTEEARQQAERRVADIYEPVRRVRSEQLARAHEVMTFITDVRADTSKTLAEKTDELSRLPDVQLEAAEWQNLLALDDEAWERVVVEVPNVLGFVMLGEINDSQLAAARRRVSSLVDLVDENEAQAATVLIRALTKPNMAFNEERTLQQRAEARAAVAPQIERYEEGEIIARAGDIITARHIETLEALGLNQVGGDRWRWVTAFIVACVMALLFGLYLYRLNPGELATPRLTGLLLAALLIFLLLAKFMITERMIVPFVFPLAAATMLVGVLLSMPIAFLTAVYFGVVAGYLSNGDVNLVVYLMLGGLVGVLVLRKGERTSAYITAGAAISAVSVALLLAFHLPFRDVSASEAVQLVAAGLANGAISASLALIGFYLLGAIFDIVTPLRLMELARPNHPLMRELVMKAPGTYHHSLLVSNMAEQAAEAIGAEAFLTRVGAYYHDVGKLNRPYFFVENRMQGIDPHSQLDPWSSAKIIISHVKDGLEIARRQKLPRRVQDFIAEHQGTGLVRTFYAEAQKQADKTPVDEAAFRYPGPKPRTRETALVMLADSCESAARAMRPGTQEEIDQLVRKIINQKMLEGELADSPLTLADLETTRRIFVQALQGAHHPRIVYPEIKPQAAATAASPENQDFLKPEVKPNVTTTS